MANTAVSHTRLGSLAAYPTVPMQLPVRTCGEGDRPAGRPLGKPASMCTAIFEFTYTRMQPKMDGGTRDEIYRLHADICRALADPNRLLLLEALRHGERSVGQLAADLGLAQAKTSQHLAILRDKGLVITRRQATTVFYSLSDPTILQAIDLLRGVLARHLERQANTHEMLLDGLQAAGQALA